MPEDDLPASLRHWAERVLGRGARLVSDARLRGGIASRVDRLTVDVGGARRHVVLKRWTDASWPDLTGVARREADALRRVGPAGLLAPELIDVCVDGGETGGHPALLMTELEGRIDLDPSDPDAWLRALAKLAATIHAAPLEGPPFERWLDPSALAPPRDAPAPDVWRAAIATVGREPAREPVFIHRDFQHFNLLWTDGHVTGVVDWGASCRGPAELDVGHCRLNLAVLFSPEWAERFRLAYEAEIGRVIDPSWDIHALLSYGDDWRWFIPLQVADRRPVDGDGMTARVEAVLAAALQRRG